MVNIQNLARDLFDKNLYGFSFFLTSLNCLIPFVILLYATYLINPAQFVSVLVTYVVIVILTGLFSKNLIIFHPMDLLFSWFFIITSIISLVFCFVAKFPEPPLGIFQMLLIMLIAIISFDFSSINIIVLSHRRSLREKFGLKDHFFENQKERWKTKLEGFPNHSKIIECLGQGRYIPVLFDRGYFNLTVLWCCSLIEEVVDEIADGILEKNPEKTSLFKRNDGRKLPYVKQLENLGYKPSFKGKYLRNLWEVWGIRNKVAHRNYQPSFVETADTVEFFICFVNEIPIVLENFNQK